MERVNSHMGFGDLNCPRKLSSEHKRNCKPPIGKIRIECDGSFEYCNRLLGARSQRQRDSELSMSQRQIGIQLYRLGSELMRSFNCSGIKIVAVNGLTVSSRVRVRKGSIRTGVFGIDGKGTFEEAARLVECFRQER